MSNKDVEEGISTYLSILTLVESKEGWTSSSTIIEELGGEEGGPTYIPFAQDLADYGLLDKQIEQKNEKRMEVRYKINEEWEEFIEDGLSLIYTLESVQYFSTE